MELAKVTNHSPDCSGCPACDETAARVLAMSPEDYSVYLKLTQASIARSLGVRSLGKRASTTLRVANGGPGTGAGIAAGTRQSSPCTCSGCKSLAQAEAAKRQPAAAQEVPDAWSGALADRRARVATVLNAGGVPDGYATALARRGGA